MADGTVCTMYAADDLVIGQPLGSRWSRVWILPRVAPNQCIPIFFASETITTYRSPVDKFLDICPLMYARICKSPFGRKRSIN